MQLEHSFTVPVPVDEAWKVLRDVERVAPCMPGATLDSVDGDEFTGSVKVKVGPITVTYRGSARFTDIDDAAHKATIEAQGKETRGSGTARASVTATMVQGDGETEVTMTTDLAITGKPAQFGRGVMADVGSKLVGQFADCLSKELAVSEAAPPVAAAPAAEAERAGAPAAVQPRPEAEPIDLFDVAGAPLGKRLAPIAVALVVLAVVGWLIRRRR